MRYKILDIREDDKGYLWFLAENYFDGQSWWLHLSDEYAFDYGLGDYILQSSDKRYEIREIEK